MFRADYIWAQAMGFTGPQIADEDGVSVGNGGGDGYENIVAKSEYSVRPL